MNIIDFAARNHKKSINQQLVGYATSLLDLNDYEMPLFSQDD